MAITKTKKQSTPAEKPKSISERIEEIEKERQKLEKILNQSWKAVSGKEAITSIQGDEKKPFNGYLTAFFATRPILQYMTSRIKLLVDELRRNNDDVSANIIETDFEAIIDRLNAGIKTNDLQALLIYQELVRRFGNTLAVTQAHYNETKNDEKINIDNVIFNSSQFTDKNDPYLSPKELSTKYDVPVDALRRRLERARKPNDNCYVEIENRKSTDPQYIYKESFALNIIKSMKEKMTSKRPAEKKV